jgi:hypothetical protein
VLAFAPEGLVLGAGTVIVAADWPHRLQSLRGQEGRVLALLSAACGKAIAPSVLANIERAAKAWNDGDECLAYIHLSHARLQPVQDLRLGAYRLFMARCAMLHGASPRDVFQALHLDPHYIDAIEKAYNPDEPRVPAGSGKTSGEWTDAGEDGSQVNPVENETASRSNGDITHAPAFLDRGPLPTPEPSFLGTLDAAQIAEFAAYASRVLRIATPIGGAAVVFTILFIPSSNDIHIEGDVPEIPGLRYSWNRDETRLLLTYDDPAGGRRTFAAYLDGDVFRDKDRQAIGRVLDGGKVAIDVAAAVPDLVKDEPKLCPEPPVPDRPGSDRGKPYEKNLPRQYEDYLKRLINPDAPTPSGYVYELSNPASKGDPVTYDDCQKKTGILFEFKWEHASVLDFSQGNKSVIDGFLDQSLRQVQASGGRPVVWIFAEAETAEIARKLFKDAGEGRERIIIIHAEWKRP